MKSLQLILIAALSAFAFQASAQCNVDFMNQTVGLSPSDNDQVPCVTQNQSYSFTYQFKNYSSGVFLGQAATINWIRFDSILNAPCGLQWATNKSDNFFTSGENGCMVFSGTTNDMVGQYNMTMWVTANVDIGAGPITVPQPASVIGIVPILRVQDGVTACPPVDTNSGATTQSGCELSNYSSIGQLDGVEEIKLYPNPAGDVMTLHLEASMAKDYTIRIVNAAGQVVQQGTYTGASGSNYRIEDLRHLPNGHYTYMIYTDEGFVGERFAIVR